MDPTQPLPAHPLESLESADGPGPVDPVAGGTVMAASVTASEVGAPAPVGEVDARRTSFWESRSSDSGVRRVGDGTRLFRLRRAGRAAETVDSGSSPAELAETQALPPEALPTEPLIPAQRPAQPGRPVIQPRLIGWPGPAAPSPSSGRHSEPDVPPDQLPLDFTDPDDLI
jgi:hypothetical protein